MTFSIEFGFVIRFFWRSQRWNIVRSSYLRIDFIIWSHRCLLDVMGESMICLFVWFVWLLVIVQMFWFLTFEYRILLNFIITTVTTITGAITFLFKYITRTHVFAIYLLSRRTTIHLLSRRTTTHFLSRRTTIDNLLVAAWIDILITYLLFFLFLYRFFYRLWWLYFHQNRDSFWERLVWDTLIRRNFSQRILMNNLINRSPRS